MIDSLDCGQVLCPLSSYFNLTSDKLVTDYDSDCAYQPTPAPTTVPPTTVTVSQTTVSVPANQTLVPTTPVIINNGCTDYKGWTKLEVALAIATGVLALSTLILAALVLSIIHKFKILKTVF